jgi:hypothetical protein
VVGTLIAEAHSDCASDGSTGCLAITDYPAAKVSNVAATDILATASLAGITGSIANCSSFGATDCYAAPSGTYQAGDISNLTADVLQNGVNLNGLTGTYPSSGNKLPNADTSGALDLNSSNFDTRMKSAVTFEFYDKSGTRYTNTGSNSITATNILASKTLFSEVGTLDTTVLAPNAWDVRVDVVVGSTTGKLKTNCRTKLNYSSTYTSWPAANNCDDTNWTDVTADGTCDALADDCVFRDELSKLYVGQFITTNSNWSNAINTCATTTYNGMTGWRMPTRMELTTLAANGLASVGYYSGQGASANAYNNTNFIETIATTFWTATTSSVLNTDGLGWQFDNSYGLSHTVSATKTALRRFLCVRTDN